MANTVTARLDKWFILHYPRSATTIPHNITTKILYTSYFFFFLT